MTELVTREIWKNVTAGLRHFVCLSAIGEQVSKTVRAGRTFSITQLERRLNQDAVYDSSADPFRNGTFLNVKYADDTVRDEISSPDSVTDGEIEKAISEAIGGDEVPYEAMIARVRGIHTAQRIFEEAVAMDAPQSMVAIAKERVESLEEHPVGDDGEVVAVDNREVISTGTPESSKSQWKSRVE